MEILINDEKLDYTLEDERSLGDVLQSVEHWVLTHGDVIHSVSADKKNIPLDYTSDDLGKDISSIITLKVQTLSRTELAFDTIKTIGAYIVKMVDEYLDARKIENHDLILEGLNLIYEGTKSSLRILNVRDLVVVNDTGRNIREILTELKKSISVYEKQYFDEEGLVLLSNLLKDLLHSLPKIVNWSLLKNSFSFNKKESLDVSFLKTALRDLACVSSKSLQKFEKIGENLQIGKDIYALNDLYSITEVFDEILWVLSLSLSNYEKETSGVRISGNSIEDVFKGITRRLKELEDAFKNGDMVSVGDLIEYEIGPLFADLVEFIRKFENFIR